MFFVVRLYLLVPALDGTFNTFPGFPLQLIYKYMWNERFPLCLPPLFLSSAYSSLKSLSCLLPKKRGRGVFTLCLDAKRLTAAKTDVTRLEKDWGRQSSVDDETMMSVVPDRTLLLTNSVRKDRDGRKTRCGQYRSIQVEPSICMSGRQPRRNEKTTRSLSMLSISSYASICPLRAAPRARIGLVSMSTVRIRWTTFTQATLPFMSPTVWAFGAMIVNVKLG